MEAINGVMHEGHPVLDIVLEKDTPPVKAEFFGEGTEEEHRAQEREDKGLKGLFGFK